MRRASESGYALLTAIFLAAMLLIAIAVAVPNVLTEGRREREEELIFRGEQYARAVKLYYRKNGRFPQSLEHLTKPQNNIRFLRRAYRDPMNTEDGSWRLIYVAPNGQLIGSTTRTNALLQIPGQSPAQPAKQPGALTPPMAGVQGPAAGGSGTAGSTGTPGTMGRDGQIIGGNIIGVGSKMALPSIRVYNGGMIYRDWEFIWDPTKDAVVIGQPGTPRPGTPPGGGARPRNPNQ